MVLLKRVTSLDLRFNRRLPGIQDVGLSTELYQVSEAERQKAGEFFVGDILG